ncbi:MAG: DUF3306 domain-containing protein [Tistlia sp.]|uniref:DUF3306 domain-containing protein n=1 Tax=Tistlia sp. TaxID=3057121 RepID=UPI0034A12A6A
MAEQGDGFLSRWARLKQRSNDPPAEERRPARRREAPPAAPQPDETELEGAELEGAEPEGAEREAREQEPDERETEALPAFEDLTLESDYRGFMRPGVPNAVRNKALQKLWRLDPVFANLDKLNDYDEDYTQIGKHPIAGLRSLYRVGRGMITGEQAAADEAAAQAAAEGRPPPEQGGTRLAAPGAEPETSAGETTAGETTAGADPVAEPPGDDRAVESERASADPLAEAAVDPAPEPAGVARSPETKVPDARAQETRAQETRAQETRAQESRAPGASDAVRRRWGAFDPPA